MKADKQSITVFINKDKEPVAIIYLNKYRNREIFVLSKAGDNDIIELLECKDQKI